MLRPREDVYGLALALRRARDFAERREGARDDPLRRRQRTPPSSGWAAQLQADQGRTEAALETYRAALKAFPTTAGSSTASRRPSSSAGAQCRGPRLARREGPRHARGREALRAAVARLRGHRQRAWPSTARRPRPTTAAATSPPPSTSSSSPPRCAARDFYELSIAEARLRELRSSSQIEREAEKALKLG